MGECSTAGEAPHLEARFWKLYRDFFDMAERRRRWSLPDDIPWGKTNPSLAPQVADVVESFCAVELYLPDYTSKILPIVRSSRGRTWFYANWGYEESKHSLALCDWLLKSRSRSDEQMFDIEKRVIDGQWNLPHDSHLGMLVYAMTQELATWLAYRNLGRRAAENGGDPALEKLLMLLAVDERAHHDFFRRCVAIYLDHDRAATLEHLRCVMNDFTMPAIHDMADSQRRVQEIQELQIMSQDLYFREVYLPILAALGVDRREMRNPRPAKKSA